MYLLSKERGQPRWHQLEIGPWISRMSTDITPTFLIAREWGRAAWNALAITVPDAATVPRLRIGFRELFEGVLSEVVTSALPGEQTIDIRLAEENEHLLVQPRSNDIAQVMWSRTQGYEHCGYWDWEAPKNASDQVALRFFDFFDWDYSTVREFEYLRVVAYSESNHATHRRHGLLPVRWATLLIDNVNRPGTTGDPAT